MCAYVCVCVCMCVCVSAEFAVQVKYFTDQGGSFNTRPSPFAPGEMVLAQVVDTRPIEWGHNPDPYSTS